METISSILRNYVSQAFTEAGYDSRWGKVTISDRTDLCQFQCNGAFGAAKEYKQPPLVIAESVTELLSSQELFSKVDAVKPGFINIDLSDKFLLDYLSNIDNDPCTGVSITEKPETIIIDYGGPNVAKPLHIGHLRSAIIGESIKRLALKTGHNVIADIHLGDWGLQIGLIIAELYERYNELPEINIDMLNEIYPFASAKSKTDEAFMQRAQEVTFGLQNGNPEYITIWKEIIRVSVCDLKNTYSRLSVDFDLWYGESDAQKYVDRLLEILQDKQMLRESDGALVMDVSDNDKEPMPPVIIKKSNNSNLYSTTDLATIIQRVDDYDPDKIWYVVDNRQALHFKQVFRCSQNAGLVNEKTEMEFLGFGTMNGNDGKPYKTRDGGVMKLQDLLDIVSKAAYENLSESVHLNTASDEEKRELASKIAISAVKFGDLINHRSRDYIFDLDKFLSFEGKTGPYILYNITRINSLLKRVEADRNQVCKITSIETKTEKDLILKIISTGDIFQQALADKAPNYICENAYQIANNFSKLYQSCRIVDESDTERKESLIALIALTRKVLLLHLDILGLEAVESM